MKRIISLLLCLSLVFTMVPAVFAADDGGLSNFQKARTYEDAHFTDVPATQWYADSVKAAYEYGLINGDSTTTYNPNGNITIAEALALACRLSDIYYGGTGSFTQGSPWYQVYVEYAISYGIITEDQYSNYDTPATRAQFVTILAKALPQEALPAINSIGLGSIPDVPASADFSSDVYMFYNAGILMGNDTYGTFSPSSNILRAEVAAIVLRLADTSQRKSFVLASTVPVTSVDLVGSAWTLYVGTPFTYSATVLPEDATNKSVTWTSSDTSVATVSADGIVTPLKAGTVIITVSSANGKTSSRNLTVKSNVVEVESVTLGGEYWSLDASTTVTLTATVSPTNATDKTITWTSSDTSVATVSSTGVVTGVKAGTAVITASSSNGKTSSRQMTVRAVASTTTTTTTAYSYLVSLAKSKGTLSSDKTYYSYIYYTDYGDSFRSKYILTYTPSKSQLSFQVLIYDDSNSLLTGVHIDESLSKPYMSTTVGSLVGISIELGADIYPSTFSSSTKLTPIVYTGPSYVKSNMTELHSTSASLALKMAEVKLLRPAGYSMSAFGFYSL